MKNTDNSAACCWQTSSPSPSIDVIRSRICAISRMRRLMVADTSAKSIPLPFSPYLILPAPGAIPPRLVRFFRMV